MVVGIMIASRIIPTLSFADSISAPSGRNLFHQSRNHHVRLLGLDFGPDPPVRSDGCT